MEAAKKRNARAEGVVASANAAHLLPSGSGASGSSRDVRDARDR